MDAYDVLTRLQQSGMSIPRISAITGVGKSTLYAIQAGTRSGETVLPLLSQLLEARGSHTSPSIGLGPRPPMVVESVRSQLPVRYQEPVQNNQWGLTPQRMMQEIQSTRMEVQELKQLLLQQNKSSMNVGEQFIYNFQEFLQVLGEQRAKKKQPQEQPMLSQRVTAPIPQTMRQIAGNASPSLTREQENMQKFKSSMR